MCAEIVLSAAEVKLNYLRYSPVLNEVPKHMKSELFFRRNMDRQLGWLSEEGAISTLSDFIAAPLQGKLELAELCPPGYRELAGAHTERELCFSSLSGEIAKTLGALDREPHLVLNDFDFDAILRRARESGV
jgi:hypothetical protein